MAKMAEKTYKPKKSVNELGKLALSTLAAWGFWYSALCLEALARALLALKKLWMIIEKYM